MEIMGTTTDLNTAGNSKRFILVVGGQYFIFGRDFPHHTVHDDSEI